MRFFSLYKIGSNEQNTQGIQERSRKVKNTHPNKNRRNVRRKGHPRKLWGDG
jgi:hypothetical protein